MQTCTAALQKALQSVTWELTAPEDETSAVLQLTSSQLPSRERSVSLAPLSLSLNASVSFSGLTSNLLVPQDIGVSAQPLTRAGRSGNDEIAPVFRRSFIFLGWAFAQLFRIS